MSMIENGTKTPARTAIREASPPKLRRGEAVGRDGAIIKRNRNYSSDPFEVPPHLKEPGWSYQWNRASCYGQPDNAEITRMMDNGWRYVKPSQFKGFFSSGTNADCIERDGLVLMERPDSLTQEAVDEAQKVADDRYMQLFKNADTDMDLPSGYRAERRGRRFKREAVDPDLAPSYGSAREIPEVDE